MVGLQQGAASRAATRFAEVSSSAKPSGLQGSVNRPLLIRGLRGLRGPSSAPSCSSSQRIGSKSRVVCRGSTQQQSQGTDIISGTKSNTVKGVTGEESLQDPLSNDKEEEGGSVGVRQTRNWGAVAGWLFVAGFCLGAPLDGLHSVVGLQVYESPGAIVIGSPVDGLVTSLWVPPLLGVMYVVVGLLQLALDDTFPPSPSVPAHKGSLTQMLTTLGVLVGLLRLSSLMYENTIDPHIIFAVLLVFAHGSWYSFDRTLPGYGLALLVGACAPVAEVAFLKLGCWHYSTPDVFIFGEGLVSWTACCYFFYTQWVATVARALDSALAPTPPTEAEV